MESDKIVDCELQTHASKPLIKKSLLFTSVSAVILIQTVSVLFLTNFFSFDILFKPSAIWDPVSASKSLDSLSLAYLKSLETNYASKWLKHYCKSNQLAGTNLPMVNWTLAKFKELGLTDSYIDEYTAYMAYPVGQSLSLLNSNDSSIIYKPTLREEVLDEDPTSKTSVPAFLGYAATGNVTAEYIFCNYGTHEDFQTLISLKVDLKGKIAIIRYGKINRGLKVKFAQDHGMSAVLIFTDTYDDGEVTTQNGFESYPKGYARNPTAIQRGSALFLSTCPGDPTTPGYAIKPGEKKPRSDPYYTIPKIPALPISYEEVSPILKKLNGYGPRVKAWKGLVKDFDYSVGPNPKFKLNLFNEQDFKFSTMYNIMGKITGKDDSKLIIVGNHHDSWTPAAADPHSGSAALLEVIRGFGELLKIGWQPNISILFASWDGEEYGLIGSTEFGEYYSDLLMKKTVAYINTDIATVGSQLSLQSSPLLYNLLLETADQISYPNSSLSLHDHYKSKNNDEIGTLGSGSDFTVFLEHLGIPSVNMEFKNDLKNSSVYQYHSIYDSYYWMSEFGDPNFVFHNLLSKYLGLVILNLSESPILKLRIKQYSVELSKYFNELEIPSEWNSKPVASGLLSHHHCSKSPANAPLLSDLVDAINDKLESLQAKSVGYDEYLDELSLKYDNWENLSPWEKIKLHFQSQRANLKLKYYERHFIDENGLKNRPWFKHLIYASGRYTGYKGQELPGLAEAIEDYDFQDFVNRLKNFEDVLNKLLRL